MKIRFFAALLLAALSITLLTGCTAVSAVSAPPQLIQPPAEESAQAVPSAPAPTLPKDPGACAADQTYLSKEQAIAIALKDAGFTQDQVSQLHALFDCDDGRPEYDVEFRQGDYEYDYEIHAETGVILDKDIDKED